MEGDLRAGAQETCDFCLLLLVPFHILKNTIRVLINIKDGFQRGIKKKLQKKGRQWLNRVSPKKDSLEGPLFIAVGAFRSKKAALRGSRGRSSNRLPSPAYFKAFGKNSCSPPIL